MIESPEHLHDLKLVMQSGKRTGVKVLGSIRN